MSLPYFPMYPTDFEAKTSHLTMEEDGAYNRLLRLCWMSPGCSLPDDDAWIMRRMRVDQETFERVIRIVLEEFFDRENGRISNARLTAEFEKSVAAHERRISAGEKGGKAKSLKTKETEPSNATAMLKQPEPEPEPIKKDPKGSKKVERPADVEPDLWSDFLAHRRAQRATLTATALKGFQREAAKARLTLSQAIQIAIERGWRGFNAEWIKPEDRPRPQLVHSEETERISAHEEPEVFDVAMNWSLQHVPGFAENGQEFLLIPAHVATNLRKHYGRAS